MHIETTKGPIDESRLVKKLGAIETDTEDTSWREYYLEGELVRRDVQIQLKKPATFVTTEQGGLNG